MSRMSWSLRIMYLAINEIARQDATCRDRRWSRDSNVNELLRGRLISRSESRRWDRIARENGWKREYSRLMLSVWTVRRSKFYPRIHRKKKRKCVRYREPIEDNLILLPSLLSYLKSIFFSILDEDMYNPRNFYGRAEASTAKLNWEALF